MKWPMYWKPVSRKIYIRSDEVIWLNKRKWDWIWGLLQFVKKDVYIIMGGGKALLGTQILTGMVFEFYNKNLS